MLNQIINYILNDTFFIFTLIIVLINICIHYILKANYSDEIINHSYHDSKTNITIHKFVDAYTNKSEESIKEMLDLVLEDLSDYNKNQLFIIQMFESSYDDQYKLVLSKPCLIYYEINNPISIIELFNKIEWFDGAFCINEDDNIKDISILIRKI